MWFGRRKPERPAVVAARAEDPPVVVLTFDRHAIDPETRQPRLGVLLEDAATREPIAARSLHDAADWLRDHHYRFGGVNGVWLHESVCNAEPRPQPT